MPGYLTVEAADAEQAKKKVRAMDISPDFDWDESVDASLFDSALDITIDGCVLDDEEDDEPAEPQLADKGRLLTLWCYICRDQGTAGIATRTCNERQKPVCARHAAGCVEDGHGTSPLRYPPAHDEDECYCGCQRAWHYAEGMCMFNLVDGHERCMEFDRYKAADDNREMSS